MNKSAIKKFAVQARNQLIKEIDQKAYEIGIEKDKIHKLENNAQIHGRTLNSTEINQRNKLIQEIEQKGYEQVIDEVAYTWFNRFVALRFMEVNGYLPTGVRVLSSKTDGKVEPDIIQEALNVDLDIEAEIVHKFEDDNDNNGLYRYLLIKQCNSLNDIMPFIFEKIADYTEILLPNDLLKEGSVIRNLVENIDNEDWQDVEIIGWLYQYYISEKKDEVIQAKKKYKKEEIPYATQLFTPDWIVRYMVQNSLGRYWIESHPEDNELKGKWEYYLENQNQDPKTMEKLEQYLDPNMKIEEVKVFDPACGSGHILVYVFDVLYQIYQKAGYLKEQIPRLIIENNLYGLEIDDRAYQLSCLSVVMKGLEYNNRFLKDIQENDLKINIASIQETNELNEEDINYLVEGKDKIESKKIKTFIKQFQDAKTYGSLTKIEEFDKEFLISLYQNLKEKYENDLFKEQKRDRLLNILPNLIKQAELINENKYNVSITNPPYMGNRYMNKKLKSYLNKNYKNYNSDLFATFIKYITEKTIQNGQIGLITPYVWMFIHSYEELREFIVENKNISSLIQLEYNAFEVATVPVCTFTLRNYNLEIKGDYIKLSSFKGIKNQPKKTLEAIRDKKVWYRYSTYTKDFNKIPGTPIGYWAHNNLINKFSEHNLLSEYIDVTGSQNITANNKKYLRKIWEVEKEKINNKWQFYTKGGNYRKWYGNIEYLVDWSEKAKNFYRTNSTSNILDKKYRFREGITYNAISVRGFTARYAGKNIYDKGGPTFHINNDLNLNYILAFLNTKIGNYIMEILNPTINYQIKDIKNIPIIIAEEKSYNYIISLSETSLNISKRDWNSFEISWDFKKHPLLKYKNDSDTIEESFNNWSEFAEEQFYQLKENEEKLNEIFIDIYGLEDELDPKVKEKNVTVRKADRARDIRSFMSYAVGCMLGRYSLDEEGLVYAGGEFDHSKYKTFKADKDGIIPVLDKEYFDDDIVARFVEFVKVTFGEENLEENLEYIADALIEGGTSGQDTARETIRRYFLFDFIKDHTSEYNKCPIYWLFQSDGRGKAFNALIYMHRYDKGTVSRVRTDYLHELQNKIESEKARLQNIIDSDLSGRQRTQAKKDLETLEKQTAELKEYDQKLNHLANQQIEIDLDDGVKENYAKFDEVLKNI